MGRRMAKLKARSFTKEDIALSALLFASTLITWFPALNGTLLWDDDGHVTKPALRSLEGLWHIWFTLGATQQYYPLLHSAFWLEHSLWGDAVFGYHLTNVVLHSIAALMLVGIVKRLKIPGAWLAGFLFALHPVTVEAVAWISEQKSTLSAVFYLSAALVYLHFDQTRKRSQYFAALVLFILALLSKSVTATLPAALLVIFWWQRGKLDNKRDVIPLLPWLIAGASSGILTAWVEHSYLGAQGAAYSLSLAQHFLLAGRALWFYPVQLLTPVNLMFFYPRWNLDPAAAWQYLFPLGFIAITGLFIWLARRNRAPLAALIFFSGTLFPVLGFLNVYPFVYTFVADHFQYLACLGILVPLAAVLTRITPDRRILAILPAILAVLTFREARIFEGQETLYTETLNRNPGSWISHNNLGNWLLDQKRFPEAISHFQATLKLKPDSAEAYNNLGSAYARMPGRLAESIAEYEAAIKIKPVFAQAHNNLGSALIHVPGRRDDAIVHLRRAVELDPTSADAQNNLGSALSETNEATVHYEAALALNPNSAMARTNLVVAHTKQGAKLMETGHLQEAIAEYETALRIDPEYVDAHNNLGTAFAQSGRISEALPHFEAAVRLQPDSPEAQMNLAGALDEIPARAAGAIPHYEAAIRLRPNLAEAHYFLGVALAKLPGRTLEALAHFEAALRLKPDAETRELVNRLKASAR